MSGTVVSATNSDFGLVGRGACQGPDEKVGLGTSSPHFHRCIWTLLYDPAVLLCALRGPGIVLLAPEPKDVAQTAHRQFSIFLHGL